ncbi:MAG: nicotinamide mononucleotide transporter family protein [Pirellulaceae bacterium]|nr:nicotinamide mononucleotide transporter family protein [Pirellulaceae bacterium]
MTNLEIVAALFGFLSVWYYIVRSIWSLPAGLFQVLLLIVVFFHAKLYADMALHVVYVVFLIYGWGAWLHAENQARQQSPTDQPSFDKTSSVGSIAIRRELGILNLGRYRWDWTFCLQRAFSDDDSLRIVFRNGSDRNDHIFGHSLFVRSGYGIYIRVSKS